MTLQDDFDFLNFWYNKNTGAWMTISELENLLDFGQIAFYNDIKPKYATSQLIKDILSPFRDTYNFTTAVSGFVIVPANRNYLDLLDLQIYYQISNRTLYYGVAMVNEDVRSQRLNSQIDPVTITSPIGEQIGKGAFRLYPTGVYNGTVTFLRRPVKPVFSYTTISQRVIVYDPVNSVQLEWRETEHSMILTKALSSIGINLTAQDLQQWAEIKSTNNYQRVNTI